MAGLDVRVPIKHRVGENSIKMYDKQGSVLRVEMRSDNQNEWRIACQECSRMVSGCLT